MTKPKFVETDYIKKNRSVSEDIWWTGAINDPNKNVWVWEHSDKELVFTNWDLRQPGDFENEHCVASVNGLWHDYPCYSPFYIICEKGV